MKNLLTPQTRIYAYSEPVDMRKSFTGLEALTRSNLGKDPLTGDLFVFINKRRTYCKILTWDRTGFVLVAKKLTGGKFCLPGTGDIRELSQQLFSLFFDGNKLY